MGLRDNTKRREMFNWLQEVHCTENTNHVWSTEWGYYHYFSSLAFMVLTADQKVGRCYGPLEQQKQDSPVCGRHRIFHLILWKTQNLNYKDDEV